MDKQIQKQLERNNIERVVYLTKGGVFVHLALLFTLDIFNYYTGVWQSQPEQYVFFWVHLVSIPVLSLKVYFNQLYLKNQLKIKYNWLIVLNILSFLPFILIYYYWGVVSSSSGAIYIVYIFIYGYTLRFSGKALVAFAIYFTTCYFGMLFLNEVSYFDNSTIYLNGVIAIFLFAYISLKIYALERKSVRNELLAIQKNERLEVLNSRFQSVNKKWSESNLLNEQLIKELNESNESLKRFAAIIAHDIRTPISMVNKFSQIIKQNYVEVVKEEHKPLFSHIEDTNANLADFVDNLLKFSTLTKNLPDKSSFNLTTLVNNIVGQFHLKLKRKNVIINVQENMPNLYSHRFLFQQLVINLIGNAIKFSDSERTNTIDVTFVFYDKDTGVLTVSDTGLGMPNKIVNNVFEAFQKYHPTNAQSGYGIGLATCKKIVEHLKGSIRFTTIEGQGTTFFIELNMPLFVEDKATAAA